MITFLKRTACFAVLLAFCLCLSAFVADSSSYIATHTYAPMNEETEDLGLGSRASRRFTFPNGDAFEIVKLTPHGAAASMSHSVFVPGKLVSISFYDSQNNFVAQTTYKDLPRKTLYIHTTECDAVLSIGAVYKENALYHTIVPQTEREVPLAAVAVTSPSPGYIFTGSFSLVEGQCGQMWSLLSTDITNERPFIAQNDQYTMGSLFNDSFDNFRSRLCYDGYYFETPDSYAPYETGMLNRNPASYTGVSYTRYGRCRLSDDLGYVILRLAGCSQNAQGYWETGCSSSWILSDFNIGHFFYDTRFNTDFAVGLVASYQKYHDAALLDNLFRYTQYFFQHAQNNHFDIQGGWLVKDYAPVDPTSFYKQTHASLNHHTAEIIFLNDCTALLKSLTQEERAAFQQYSFVQNPQLIDSLAQKMLLGIENSVTYWIKSDGNLRYAYGYTGTANAMVDYPYLTYNDLYTLNKQLKATTGQSNQAISWLMVSKKRWMDSNKITGYVQ